MQIIELSGDESIAVIRGLIESAADKDVVLYVPRGCEALDRNEVNLRVLRRWADNLALRLALVVDDRATQVFAKEAGFLLLPSVSAASRVNLQGLDRKRRRHKGLPPSPSPSLLFPALGRSAPGRDRLKRLSGLRAGLLVITGALLALAATVFLLLPGATIVLRPSSEPVEASMDMTGIAGLTEVDYGRAEVPARIVSVELTNSDTIPTTDKRDVPDGYAQGSVVFVNRTSIPVAITTGTVVRTSYGENVRFYTVADAQLPGELHGTVRVSILAAEPGPQGNVQSLTINVVEGEFAAQLDVLNDSRTAGGTVRRISTVHSADKVSLRAKLLKRLQEESYSELTSSLTGDEFVPQDSLVIEVLGEEFDHKVNDIADQLGVQMTVRVRGLAVSAQQGQQLLLSLLRQRTRPGYRLMPDSAVYERGPVTQATPEQASFSMKARAVIVPLIDEGAVSNAVAGKSLADAQQYLSQQFALRQEPAIDLTGSFLRRLPWWSARIQVQIRTD